ncbi:MAG: cupin domain-containing protein [Tistlia sp.]|uniref:cupin domain-containing protein n=1 Tax=Tistlia sp. TaxID=3057121 RepID=UPI0034A2E884
MSEQTYQERVTIDGKNVVISHDRPPVQNAGILERAEIFRLINIFSEQFTPSNLDKADGTPLRLYSSDHVKIDVSKRRKHDMSFWHRNVDAHEIIFCVQGALRWETEMGVKTMHAGDMLMIPRGIAHRSLLCEDSTDDNVLLELKISDELTYVGEPK